VVDEKVHIPEVIEPDEKLPADLVALRKFSILMDEAVGIPGTSFRFGLSSALSVINFTLLLLASIAYLLVLRRTWGVKER